MRVEVRPAATDEEVAAIVAAAEILLRPVPGAAGADAPGAPDGPSPAWRFSGRWWSAPVPLRRERPWWPA